MNIFSAYSVLTSNILGSFTDPFEFQGTYGEPTDGIRQTVFEQVVSQEALIRNFSDEKVRFLLNDSSASKEEVRAYQKILIDAAIVHDQYHGPTLSEMVTPDLLQKLENVWKEQNLDPKDLKNFISFVQKYGNQKIFRLLRNNPKEFLGLDKALRDRAARSGKDLELSILSSTYPLKGKNIQELKIDLMEQLFSKETFALTKSEEILTKSLTTLDVEKYLGIGAKTQDLEGFCTPAGQVLFYWLYQSLNLHLVAQDSQMIDQINRVKELFVKTLGNPAARAQLLKEKIEGGDFGVVFTQECDAAVRAALEETFLPLGEQNGGDGTFVFLRKDLWAPHYQVLSLLGYSESLKGKTNLVLATSLLTGEKFLLASCHGDSNNAADGRLQISLIMDLFTKEADKHPGLQLILGADANTKSPEEVTLLREHLSQLGLTATSVGPTTIKQRMVTVQHAKAGRAAIDEEDFLITLKPQSGGRYHFTNLTVGFSKEKPDLSRPLPDLDHPSDHYPVGARFEKLS